MKTSLKSASGKENHEIAQFFLYGEPARSAGPRFAHLELLDDRSRPANWMIRPHAHRDLHHVFCVEFGAAVATADGRAVVCAAPCFIVVPAGVVHGFDWRADSQGRVLTFSEDLLASLALREPQLGAMFTAGLWSAPAEIPAIRGALDALERELAWAAPGHELAVECHLSTALIAVLRQHRAVGQAGAPPGAAARLVARYRQLLESEFRDHPTVGSCTRRLGVSAARLRAACQEVVGASPAAILHARLALEAQRLMRYSNMSVAQVGLYLGFEDPAYFSRFFRRAVGMPPRAFKAGQPLSG